ncbi:sensor histidine kinase [Lactobacillus sp. PSON]|uniref:sensor histidine kinase n=1 Tax=Lactobacillus sp. PSON TaxID=3455454 RepID=UPI0040416919
MTYLYFTGVGIGIIYSTNQNYLPVSVFLSIMLIIQTIFGIGFFYLLIRLQKNILNKQQQEKLQEELLQQKEYAEALEKEEDSLRRFRHDYKNMLTAVNYSVKMGNYDEAIAELDRYSEKNLDENALLKYKDVNHVKDEYVKSLLIAKISKMANDGIKYNFECRKDIPSLSEDIERLDLIRILGIAIDNAIEENEKILVTSNKNDTDIQIMMNTSEDVKLEFEIRNKILTDDVSLAQMKKRGYTTKKDHEGVGLANIEQIKQKYPAMDISYSIEDGYFDFYMVIEEDENYDEDNYL